MADLKKSQDISIFKYFTGTLNDFLDYFGRQTAEEQTRLNEMVIFIHEADVNIKQGYIRANGKYYTSDISEFETLIKNYINNTVVPDLKVYIDNGDAVTLSSSKTYTDNKFATVETVINQKVADACIRLELDYIQRDAFLRDELLEDIADAVTTCKEYTDEVFGQFTPIPISYIESLS